MVRPGADLSTRLGTITSLSHCHQNTGSSRVVPRGLVETPRSRDSGDRFEYSMLALVSINSSDGIFHTSYRILWQEPASKDKVNLVNDRHWALELEPRIF